MRKLEVYAVLAIGVFYSFLIQLERPPQQGVAQYDFPVLTWALPIMFPLLAVIRASAFDRQIKLIAEYLNKVEARYGARHWAGSTSWRRPERTNGRRSGALVTPSPLC